MLLIRTSLIEGLFVRKSKTRESTRSQSRNSNVAQFFLLFCLVSDTNRDITNHKIDKEHNTIFKRTVKLISSEPPVTDSQKHSCNLYQINDGGR